VKRPYLVHFIAIDAGDYVNIRASLTLADREQSSYWRKLRHDRPSSPWDSRNLLSSQSFQLKVVTYDKEQNKLFSKHYDSDAFGNFQFKLAHPREKTISAIQVFETQYRDGLELLVGSYIPLKIHTPKKIVISDFDKTLVDTRYSTTSEVYDSLTKPLEYFPSIGESIELLKGYIKNDYQPFILTASPHFYENAIRDWLYQQQIYTAGVFLKDYRSVFSFLEGDLTPKDMKAQGFYKLNHLVTILLMTGVPNELCLMGDGFESDTLIYLTLASLLSDEMDPWQVWQKVRKQHAFRLTNRQNSQFLNKIYQLQDMVKQFRPERPKVHIHIRKKSDLKPVSINLPFLQKHHEQVKYYMAPGNHPTP
jgi:alpha-L-arabinofuranosidase